MSLPTKVTEAIATIIEEIRVPIVLTERDLMLIEAFANGLLKTAASCRRRPIMPPPKTKQ